MFRILSLIALFMLLSVSVSAQVAAVPQLMNFQGRLAKPDGTPVADGNYSIRFSLWTAATGGTEKWNQTINPVTVRNGTFAVLLNTSTGAADKYNNNLWLEIKIGTNSPLTPRQQLVTVAYAFKAENVKDNSITSASIADGTILGADIAGGTITADKFASGIFNSLTWSLSGNAGTTSAHFLGTTDNTPLQLRVNNHLAMLYSYAENTTNEYRSVNVLGGADINYLDSGVVGATISGGGQDNFTGQDRPNRVHEDFGTIGGGAANIAGTFDHSGGTYATVAGGLFNWAHGNVATVGGGISNFADGVRSTVGGGDSNQASGYYSTIGGGIMNFTYRDYSTVAGGSSNWAYGAFSFVAGGGFNNAQGDFSFAAGRNAQALHDGAFVWSGNQTAPFSSTHENQFLINAQGGVGINTNSPSPYALKVNGSVAGVGNYNNISDVRYKQNIAIFGNALDAILTLRGVTFDWKPTPGMNFAEGRQIGFIAQEVEKVLPELVTTDRNGYKSVAYANVVPVLVEAVKQQQKQMETDRKQMQAKEQRLSALEAENAQLKARLAVLNTRLSIRPRFT